MLTSKGFWVFMMTGAVGLFLLIALIGYGVLADRALETTIVLVLYWSIHVTEIPHGIRVGRSRGVGGGTAAFKTFLFGFTWWLPLKWGVIDA
ncbi:MAG: hypothetical protein PHV00_07900 [Syntrophales bacterium]|jgi:hypothetical protein|nr:hypothetical protein [Syntrophales bacterium]HOG07679.1 hypothetical protein [Syntrophales bacterium]